jgi:uncharacterized protein YdhG (YjbR/CyaY superfamily)
MRQTSSEKRGPAAIGKAAPHDVDEYLARLPQPARGTLSRIRATIRAAAPPDATEAISYGMPAFKYKGGLVAYAAFSNHCSFFPMDPAVIEAFRDELKAYQTSKGTIQFPVDKPLPAALVKKIVKTRVAGNEQKKRR